MGLDVVLFRPEGDLALVKESQRRRFKPEEQAQAVIAADEKWKKTKYEFDQANQQKNKIQDEITAKRKAKEDATALIAQKEEVEKRIDTLKKQVAELEFEVTKALRPIGNIVHASVPVSDNEDNNEVIKKWGEFKSGPEYRHHFDLLAMVDGVDILRGVKVGGHRSYFLKGVGVQLNFALMSYGMDFLAKRNYVPLQPPYLMNKDVMAKTAQLEQFDEELYKVNLGPHKDADDQDDEKYLIATSEQPISALHQGEWMDPKDLPIRYAGVSTCFRKEAGSHGKDVRGIFRVHQFEKIEQFCITSPETSWEMHEEMIKASEEFYQSLGIPYHIVVIVSGALNNAASKKYDLEGWFPSFNEFRELVSCSNCTDYQSRDLEIRYGAKKQGAREKKYVHMLNSTLCATTRTICAILENYQTPDGIVVPEVLRPYMGGKDFIPFTIKEVPKSKGEKGK